MKASMKRLQKEVIANRNRRGWESAHDLSRTTLGLAEEVGEFERARKTKNRAKMLDALADIAVYCLGGFEILGADALTEVTEVIVANKNRTHKGHH